MIFFPGEGFFGFCENRDFFEFGSADHESSAVAISSKHVRYIRNTSIHRQRSMSVHRHKYMYTYIYSNIGLLGLLSLLDWLGWLCWLSWRAGLAGRIGWLACLRWKGLPGKSKDPKPKVPNFQKLKVSQIKKVSKKQSSTIKSGTSDHLASTGATWPSPGPQHSDKSGAENSATDQGS